MTGQQTSWQAEKSNSGPANTTSPVAELLHKMRRAIIQLIIRGAIGATGLLPIRPLRTAVRRLIALGGVVPTLRWRVREHMRLALGDDVPAGAERRYFQHVGWVLSSSLVTFQHGLAATPVLDEVKFDETIKVLDDALSEGRGVVFTAPHNSGHELVAAVLARRYPIVFLVRQGAAGERAARKAKWYRALGAELVLRPDQASTIKDAVAYLKVLKSGKILAITPDLLAGDEGVAVTIFGRSARLYGGAFALAIAAGAPMIRMSGVWQSNKCIVLTFDRAPPPPDHGDRDAVIQAYVQDWCCWFEDKLRAHPENWLFWLDKRWSRFLRTTPRVATTK